MSLSPRPVPDVPEQTVLVARAAFPQGHPYLTLRDELGPLFSDEDFVDLFPSRGQLAYPPWRLALVTILQFRENLTDRSAADAVRARIDWKYLLGLELTDSGFDYSVLSEFRDRLIGGSAEERLLDKLLVRLKEVGLLKKRGTIRTDSTHVLAAVRLLNRLEVVAETMRATLNVLATVVPEWLQQVAPEPWYERYGRPIREPDLPQGEKERQAYLQQVAEDGYELLRRLNAAPHSAKDLPMVTHMRKLWEWQFKQSKPPNKRTMGRVRIKKLSEHGPAGERPDSPYDHDIRYANKGNGGWIGYKVQLSETCDEAMPRLLICVVTTPGSTHDCYASPVIHQALAKKNLLPGKHLVDSHYPTAKAIVAAHNDYSVALIGATMANTSWQGRKRDAFSTEDFAIDWKKKVVTCPQGKHSRSWGEYETKKMGRFVRINFNAKECMACPVRAKCTTTTSNRARQMTFKRREDYEALQAVRQYMQGDEGQAFYQLRAGIEGTISKGTRGFGLRRTRYRGLDKTHLSHVATAAAMNIDRYYDYRQDVEKEPKRISRFAALAIRN